MTSECKLFLSEIYYFCHLWQPEGKTVDKELCMVLHKWSIMIFITCFYINIFFYQKYNITIHFWFLHCMFLFLVNLAWQLEVKNNKYPPTLVLLWFCLTIKKFWTGQDFDKMHLGVLQSRENL